MLDADGQPLEGCLFGAAGMDGSSEYQSLVIYHHNSPSWAETVRLAIPIDKFYGSHVRFEFRHCSSKFRPDTDQSRPLGPSPFFSFLFFSDVSISSSVLYRDSSSIRSSIGDLSRFFCCSAREERQEALLFRVRSADGARGCYSSGRPARAIYLQMRGTSEIGFPELPVVAEQRERTERVR